MSSENGSNDWSFDDLIDKVRSGCGDDVADALNTKFYSDRADNIMRDRVKEILSCAVVTPQQAADLAGRLTDQELADNGMVAGRWMNDMRRPLEGAMTLELGKRWMQKLELANHRLDQITALHSTIGKLEAELNEAELNFKVKEDKLKRDIQALEGLSHDRLRRLKRLKERFLKLKKRKK